MRRGHGALAGLVIALAGAAAYLPALRGGFVFDDVPLLQQSDLVRGPLWRVWFNTSAPDYWPLTMSTFWAEWRLWGEAAWGYHATNLALHLAAALLLWRVLRRLGLPGAWLAGLLFAIHPVTVESVAWISERKNTLSAVLFLGAILGWLDFEATRRARGLGMALLLFALALLAKASVAPLPFVLLGISAYRRGRLERTALAAAAPFFALSLAAGAVTLWFQHNNAMAQLSLPQRGLAERVGAAGRALAFYVEKAFVPVHLAFVHPGWPLGAESPRFFLPLVLVVATLALLWRFRAGWGRAPLFALGYQAIMVLPILGLVDIAYFRIGPVSNHLQYLALMGPVALVAGVLARGAARWRVAALAASAAVTALFLASTARRAAAFEDELTLWQEAVRAAPASTFARHQLAVCLAERGRGAEALAELEAMARAARDPAERHHARSLWLVGAGRPAEAVVEGEEAVRLRPDPEFRRDLAVALIRAGRAVDAIGVLEPLVHLAPSDADYRYWLGAALTQAGRLADAIEVLREGCRLAPGDARMREALSTVLAHTGAPPAGRPPGP